MNKKGDFILIKDNLPHEYKLMSEERKERLKVWIYQNFDKRKTINKAHTSYGLKHMIQSDTGEYYTNDEFKGGMLEMGYIPDNIHNLNWCFNLSEKSYKETQKRIDVEKRGYDTNRSRRYRSLIRK